MWTLQIFFRISLNLVPNLFNVNPKYIFFIRLILVINMLILRWPAKPWKKNGDIIKDETNPRDKPNEHLT